MKTLVIGYGNELRGDDGAGPHVARQIAARGWPNVSALAVHQLTPELAEPLAAAAQVIFVDAATEGAAIEVHLLAPATGGAILTHAGEPRRLLALARSIFGRAPTAWLVTIKVPGCGFGLTLSPNAEKGAERAFAAIRDLIDRLQG